MSNLSLARKIFSLTTNRQTLIVCESLSGFCLFIMEFKRYFYTDYLVSKCGLVKNKKGKQLSPFIHNGYYVIELFINGQRKRTKVHRMVAIVHKPNVNFLNLVVNHLDGNKLNNNIENLEWVTIKENNRHYHQYIKNL